MESCEWTRGPDDKSKDQRQRKLADPDSAKRVQSDEEAESFNIKLEKFIEQLGNPLAEKDDDAVSTNFWSEEELQYLSDGKQMVSGRHIHRANGRIF